MTAPTQDNHNYVILRFIRTLSPYGAPNLFYMPVAIRVILTGLPNNDTRAERWQDNTIIMIVVLFYINYLFIKTKK